VSRGRTILKEKPFNLTLERLSHQIIETYTDFTEVCIIGIQERGVVLAERLLHLIKKNAKQKDITFGKLDITFYRDDFRSREIPLKASSTDIDFSIDGKKIILVDDVLYTGRSVHAAMSALQDHGRASTIELVCLVDRRFNRHLPIKADYVGITVDSIDEAYVKVEWAHVDGADKVLLFTPKREQL